MDIKEITKKVLQVYGKEAQMLKCIEEFAELTSELCRFKLGKKNAEKICNEIADCQIMIDQAGFIFGTAGMFGAEEQKKSGNYFEHSHFGLIRKTIGVMREVQLWLIGYQGTKDENGILQGLFAKLHGYLDLLSNRFGHNEVANCRAYKLRRLELRLKLLQVG